MKYQILLIILILGLLITGCSSEIKNTSTENIQESTQADNPSSSSSLNNQGSIPMPPPLPEE